MLYKVYTDGACSGNPGVGGYAAVIINEKNQILKLSGFREETTNNQMELAAIIRAILHIIKNESRKKFDIEIYSDSAYCVNAIEQKWLYFWQKNEWKTRDGNDVKNKILWMKLFDLLEENKSVNFKFIKVKGHCGNKYNELADKLAKNAINLNAKALPRQGAKK